QAGFLTAECDEARVLVASLMPVIKGAVDTLADAPARLHTVFRFDANGPAVANLAAEPSARVVVGALRGELAVAPRLGGRQAFRAIVERVKAKSGHKGKALFHPIRVALTGEDAGPELDLAVPAIDRGAELSADSGVVAIVGCRERAAAVAASLS